MVTGITVIVIAVVVVVRGVMMVTVVIMARLIIRMGMHKGSREGTHWCRKGHAQRGCERKQPNHRPDESDGPCACPFQCDQHGFLIHTRERIDAAAAYP